MFFSFTLSVLLLFISTVTAAPGHTPLRTIGDSKRACPVRKCPICEYGYKVDGWGCEICECLRGPCPERYCMNCGDAGFTDDRHGCQTCICKKVCEPLNCTNRCDYGYDRDTQGCLSCQCNTQTQHDKQVDYFKCLQLFRKTGFPDQPDADQVPHSTAPGVPRSSRQIIDK